MQMSTPIRTSTAKKGLAEAERSIAECIVDPIFRTIV
jgi:hypothetical protein